MKQYNVHFVSGVVWIVESTTDVFPQDGWWRVKRWDFKDVAGFEDPQLAFVGFYNIQMANVEAVKET